MNEIKIVQEAVPSFDSHDFDFLIQTASLVLEVRRALSYTYAIRYNLKGKLKQELFDFLVVDMERALEILTKMSEENWTD